MFAPDEALNSLKCRACSKYLSIFPVYLSSENSSLCGRCAPYFAEDCYIHNSTYEAIAQHLKFPCIYEANNCAEKLVPAKMLEHEKQCRFRIVTCQSEKCLWQGFITELKDHFEEAHPALILNKGEFEIDLIGPYEISNLVVFDEEIFTFRRKYDADNDNVITCSLSCHGIIDVARKYKYEIIIENAARNLSMKLEPKVVDVSDISTNEIDVQAMKKALNDPSIIIGTINISEASTPDKNDKNEKSEAFSEMLKELECPICFHYIIPPIYQCETGHSICSTCKDLHKQCPTCQSEIKNIRNFALENMAEQFLVYPCRYQDAGCNFSGKPQIMREHERYCPFHPQQCPLHDYDEMCSWKESIFGLMSHIVDQHYDNLLDVDVVTVFITDSYFEEEEENCYILQFANRLFKLHYLYRNNRFYWAMQLIGPPEESNLFKFEIDIIDTANREQRIFVKSFCAPLTDKNHCFETPGQYVFFNLEQINMFISDILSYRVRVLKQ